MRASRLVHAISGDSAGIGFQVWFPAPHGAGQRMRSQRINFGLEGRNGHGMGGFPGVVTASSWRPRRQNTGRKPQEIDAICSAGRKA